jgi:hypothetical protein
VGVTGDEDGDFIRDLLAKWRPSATLEAAAALFDSPIAGVPRRGR